jgi:hypothetical protein
VEIRNPKVLDGAQEPEPEPTERTMSFLNLIDGLRVTDPGIRLSVDSDCNEKRTNSAGKIFMRMLALLL